MGIRIGILLTLLWSGISMPHSVHATDTTRSAPPTWHLHLTFSGGPDADNGPWYNSALSKEEAMPLNGAGGEAYMRWHEHWLFGISILQQRHYVDVFHSASFVDGVHHGEQMGLFQRLLLAGPAVYYEPWPWPWPYPRRRKVGATLKIGAGAGWVRFSEERYVIPSSTVSIDGPIGLSEIDYERDHDGRQSLGADVSNGVYGELVGRVDLHFGRYFSMSTDLGLRAMGAYDAGGASYTSADGTLLEILPHTCTYPALVVRGGFAFHY